LLNDDATLPINFFLLKGYVCSPFIKNIQTGLKLYRFVGRYLKHVHRFVEGGIRVQVGTEPHTHALNNVDELLLLVFLSAVEGHVLGKVGQTELVVVFEDGAGIYHEPQFGAILRLLIPPDVVSKPVIEAADPYVRVERQLVTVLQNNRNLRGVVRALDAVPSRREASEHEAVKQKKSRDPVDHVGVNGYRAGPCF